MIILGVESTAHTFGIGIVDDQGNILSNQTDSYSNPEGGMLPDKVVLHHEQVAEELLQKALAEAGIGWEDIDLIAYSAGPGIDPVLWVGYKQAKAWAEEFGKRLVGVNHCAAHLSIGKLVNKLDDPVYLYVSGVNTQVIVYDGGKYRVMGETLDIGLGNMLDKLGRVMKLGFPAGAKMEELALKGEYVELTYVVKGMDTSFSGILNKVKQLLEKGISKEDLCFSVQETCFAMMAEVSERALAHTGKKELLLVGGVGANKRFCAMLEIMCKERGVVFSKVPMKLAGDNGAMIAWEGFLRKDEYGDEGVKTFWRTDEV
ncbi:MAG: KEOPS complex N(6)-L-threonylcarbamoyladenine synthase Kae1 [Candidatus Woesearchaeota archaeon]